MADDTGAEADSQWFPEGSTPRTLKSSESKLIHTKTSFGGASAMDVHRAIAWKGKRCFMCGGLPVIRIKSYCMVEAFKKANPVLVAQLALASETPGQLPVYPTTMGDAYWISDAFACGMCKKGAETAAAKHGSDFFVEIDRGPAVRNAMVAVPH